ncbi:MAG: tetratricopeptide repeat protein, partial [Planctomycetes bacterium]|nr:tetratricopeptide repeat protein [Planctomycetota bacterium]
MSVDPDCVDAVFHEASERSPDDRAAFLDEACDGDAALRAEVDRLLAFDARTNPLVDGLTSGRGAALLAEHLGPRSDVPATLPESIGGYRITRVLGRGGMGVVYEAEQDSPKRTVALKVINPGITQPSLLRRLEYEVAVLGRLHHPGIAQIYEAGTFDAGAGGQPYFAMELIRGRSLTEYAFESQLDVRDRLGLIALVADAVQHAHSRGVIHRDLKPGNILVDEHGQPKVLDFGVARATDSDIQTTTLRTDIGQLIGTIPYMSPEQASGDPDALDNRSDVYALGVLTYELLAGRLPYDLDRKMIHEAVSIIRDTRPVPLSTVERRLRGDVETIVGTALEKDKSRRYQTAAAFADDIRRYLDHETINARPPTFTYQLRTFARRNRPLVAATSAVFLILVVALIAVGVALAHAIEAGEAKEAEATRATEKATTAEHVSEFLIKLFAESDPEARTDREITVREILDRGAEQIHTDLADEPEVRATLLLTMGRAYHSLGDFARASELLSESLALRRQTLGNGHLDVAVAAAALGSTEFERGNYEYVTELVEERLAIQRAQLPADAPELALSLNDLGWLRYGQGKFEEAERLHREALAIRTKRFGEEHEATAESLNNLAGVMQETGRYDEAEALYERALAIRRAVLNPEHPLIADSIQNLATLYEGQRRLDEAERYYREAIALTVENLGPEHPDLATYYVNLGRMLALKKDLPAAEKMLRRALAIERAARGDDHPYVAYDLGNLGRVLRDRGELDEAAEMYREAIRIYRAQGPAGLSGLSLSTGGLAIVLNRQGKYAEAEPLARESLAYWREDLGDAHFRTHGTWCILGISLAGLDRYDRGRGHPPRGVRRHREPSS